MTSGTASSAVTADGGGATVYYKQIPAGLVDEGNPSGYGAGLYGVGLYGTALTSSGARSYPRIWFMDRHADDIILTAGNQTEFTNGMGVQKQPRPRNECSDESKLCFRVE